MDFSSGQKGMDVSVDVGSGLYIDHNANMGVFIVIPYTARRGVVAGGGAGHADRLQSVVNGEIWQETPQNKNGLKQHTDVVHCNPLIP